MIKTNVFFFFAAFPLITTFSYFHTLFFFKIQQYPTIKKINEQEYTNLIAKQCYHINVNTFKNDKKKIKLNAFVT